MKQALRVSLTQASLEDTRGLGKTLVLLVLLVTATAPWCRAWAMAEPEADAETLKQFRAARANGDRAQAVALADKYLGEREATLGNSEPLNLDAVQTWYEQDSTFQRQSSAEGVVRWKRVKADFNRQFPSLSKRFTQTVEVFLRFDIEHVLSVVVKEQGMAWDDWAALKKQVKAQFPDYDAEGVYWMQRAIAHTSKQQWSEACGDIDRMFRADGRRVIWRSGNTNILVYSVVFQHCDDKGTLRQSAKWMERLVAANPKDVNAIDTLASVLYKLGNKAEAMRWEQRALDQKPDDADLAATLTKMKVGERWETEAR